MPFNERRLSIARQRRMLNQKGFAKLLGVPPNTVSRWELGRLVPQEETVRRFSSVLRFPVEFFYGDDLDSPEAPSFRSQSAMSAASRDAALAAGSLGFLISDWVEQRFDLPSPDLPDLQHFEPSAAARALREHWGLGERPISNMMNLLEAKGVRLFGLSEETRHLNAFSLWRRGGAFVFLNNYKSGESSRFDCAHELGHLVLHQDGRVVGRVAEDQANEFASEFLMPRASVLAAIPRAFSLETIIRHKHIWRVSVAALNYRLHKLRITSDWQYRDFCIQIANRKFNTIEPEPIERETSFVWDKLLRLLWHERKTVADLASEISVLEEDVSSLVFSVTRKSEERRASTISLVA